MLFFIYTIENAQITNVSHLNTSHVILYHQMQHNATPQNIFKYISCYSLSLTDIPSSSLVKNLNTSHVILYQPARKEVINCLSNLNTSHVILYLAGRGTTGGTFGDLNTSHVILYRKPEEPKRELKKPFKYISCYSLSCMGRGFH